MGARTIAAPPAPISSAIAKDRSSTFSAESERPMGSHLDGDVQLAADVLISPGASIFADGSRPVRVGSGVIIQDGVAIHSLDQGSVLGDDQKQYSVWVGEQSSITHKSLIHGPVYIGDNCFIGFRSTVFNARIGQGSIIMMHVLIQDVVIPPGRYVPSGSVITSQQQADSLPDVRPQDVAFAQQVVGSHAAHPIHRSATPSTRSPSTSSFRSSQSNPEINKEIGTVNSYSNSSPSLSADLQQQVKGLLAQGYQIGTEHADQRRFRTSSWSSCEPFSGRSESEVMSALNNCLSEHQGEYVRLLGIDKSMRRRVFEAIIQRPGETVASLNGASVSYGTSTGNMKSRTATSGTDSATGLPNTVVQTIRQLLKQGFAVGTEYADPRRYRANSWYSGPKFQGGRETEALNGITQFLSEQAGNYVRIIGIDTQRKQRVVEMIIQDPKGVPSNLQPAPTFSPGSTGSSFGSNGGATASPSGKLDASVMDQIQGLVAQGHRIGVEYADPRRFKINSWQSGSPIQGRSVSDAVAGLERCMAENSGNYVRLIGIDTKAKRRVVETVLQRP